jgi:hypothetical protein
MTLIAVHTRPQCVEFITDEISYTPNLRTLGRSSKAVLIPHFDAAVIGQGDSDFTMAARYSLLLLANEAATFDEVTDVAPDLLRDQWAERTTGRDASPAVVLLVGWSERTGRFATYTYAMENDFKATAPNGLWCLPSPWTARPTGLESRRLREFAADKQHARETLATWQQQPPWPAPTTPDDWRDLAIAVRAQRSLGRPYPVLVGGRVKLTTVTRGSSTTTTVHEFDDTGEELRQAVLGSSHPSAQIAPCWCDSGEQFIDCHFAPYVDEPCGCGGDQVFRDCCMVERPALVTDLVAAAV